MAEILESFEFCNGRNKRYPWNLWFDGQIWKLTRGVDFLVPTRNFQCGLSTAVKRHGVKIRTSVIDDKTIVIQAFSIEAKP